METMDNRLWGGAMHSRIDSRQEAGKLPTRLHTAPQ